MTCTCPKPSLHDRVLRAISIRNGEEYSDLVTAAARLLVKLREEACEAADAADQLDSPDPDYALLIADIDNETCGVPEMNELAALRSAAKSARSVGKENLAEDIEGFLAELEEDAEEG